MKKSSIASLCIVTLLSVAAVAVNLPKSTDNTSIVLPVGTVSVTTKTAVTDVASATPITTGCIVTNPVLQTTEAISETVPPTECPTDIITEEPTEEPTAVPTPTQTPNSASRSSTETTEYFIHKELFEGVKLIVGSSRIYYGRYDYDMNEYISKLTPRTEENIEMLAKLLCCEAGADSSWALQVWTLSAILNNLDRTNTSLWVASHNKAQYSVAPWVDGAKPSALNYKAIQFVLDGNRIANINCFRTKYYHSFGDPVASVDGEHYFSVF